MNVSTQGYASSQLSTGADDDHRYITNHVDHGDAPDGETVVAVKLTDMPAEEVLKTATI